MGLSMLVALFGPMGSSAQVSAAGEPAELTGFVVDDRWAEGRDQSVQVFIRLDLPSVAEYAALTGAHTEAQKRHGRAVLDQQDEVRRALDGLIEEELSSLVVSLNGWRAIVRLGDIPAISTTDGVSSVTPVVSYRPAASTNLSAVGADTVHGAGLTGKGVRIAVIDTGIDYTHRVFQLPADDRRPFFVDVPADHTFEPDVAWLAEQDITRGCDAAQTRFCPDEPVTRGQMAAFLARALDLPAGTSVFSDVDGSPFVDEITRLAEAGITSGCNPPDNDRFCPDRALTRGEMASLLARAFELSPGDPDRFADVQGAHARSAAALAEAGITHGCDSDGIRFCPDRTLVRAEMAAMLHRAFRVAGLPSHPVPAPYDGAAVYESNDPDVVETGSFPVGRVVGGIDLAGSHYDLSGGPTSQPTPDADPLDQNGHGTHVASVIAGAGGVAPGAELMAIKVFGDNGGTTDLVLDGIEAALDPNQDLSMDDAPDIIDLSSSPITPHRTDPSATALAVARRAGVVVVTAGGNDVADAPDDPISVADILHEDASVPALRIEAPDDAAGVYPVTASALTSSEVTGDLAVPVPRDGCTPIRGDMSGLVALVQRGTCQIGDKARNAAAAGAVGLVVGDKPDSLPPELDSDGLDLDIPVVLVDHATADLLSGLESPVVTLSPRVTAPAPGMEPPSSPSAGAADISAPGRHIVAAAAGSGDGETAMSGSSVAAAHVSGAAALLLEADASASPGEVEATLLGSASPLSYDAAADTSFAGGVLDIAAAVEARAIPVPTILRLAVDGSGEASAQLGIRSTDGTDRVYAVTVEPDAPEWLEMSLPATVETDNESTALTVAVDPDTGTSETPTGRVVTSLVLTAQSEPFETIRIPVVVDVRPPSEVTVEPSGDGLQVVNSSPVAGRAEGFASILETADGAIGYRLADEDRLQIGLARLGSGWGSEVPEAVFLVDVDRDGVDDYALTLGDHGLMRGGAADGQAATATIDLGQGGGPAGYLAVLGRGSAIAQWDTLGEHGFLDERQSFDLTPLILSGSGSIVVGPTRTVDPWQSDSEQLHRVVQPGGTATVDSSSRQVWLFPDNRADGQATVVGGD